MHFPSINLAFLALSSTTISAFPNPHSPSLFPRGTRFSSPATGNYIYKQLYNRQGQAIYSLPAEQKSQLFQNIRDQITAQPDWETAIAPPHWLTYTRPKNDAVVHEFSFARTGGAMKTTAKQEAGMYTLRDLMDALDQMEGGGPDIATSDESGFDAGRLPVTRVQAYGVDGRHAANIRFDVFQA